MAFALFAIAAAVFGVALFGSASDLSDGDRLAIGATFATALFILGWNTLRPIASTGVSASIGRIGNGIFLAAAAIAASVEAELPALAKGLILALGAAAAVSLTVLAGLGLLRDVADGEDGRG